ncbi:MAG: isoleucine--tRNA ligase [Phascolarctobacterium sp.]|nr:isoleucine--tRNA ligase [Phascolarctobacterium sp.]
MAIDYSTTLNLPETEFPMRGNLPQREPEFLKFWQDNDIYWKKHDMHAEMPKWVLHDGPPYANGKIHMGTALNKILKDIIIKYKYAQGFDTPYVPGWDTHGMPIEHAAIKELGLDRSQLDPLTLRRKCHEFALQWLDVQREDFKRLGVLGDWEHPYVTLHHSFEAEQIRVFGTMAKKGYIYKGKKTVYWCPHCETALAEAEIEYGEQKTPTIFVKMPIVKDNGMMPEACKGKKAYMVIWTTTPWTMPANVAVCLSPTLEYAWVECEGEVLFMAKELLEDVAKRCHKEFGEVYGITMGKDMEFAECVHPFPEYNNRKSLVVLADYVTTEAGTGCVHTAPGHGDVDFETGLKYKLPILCPVDNQGKLTAEAGEKFEGMFVFDANIPILKYLAEINMLLGKENIKHQYAHCWRCKNPIIFRATAQWFASVDGFRDDTLKAIANDVQWIPSWGQQRIHNMVSDRHDWCISRQRVWGVPIPVFYCDKCGEHIINDETINSVADIFAQEGSDAWWAREAAELLPEGFKCPNCGHDHFSKESDIMDVWFDSGSSHFAVCAQRPELTWPVDMYLEGSDQHRGWFQSSILTSVAVSGKAPYKSVLTHGYVVDGEGRKMSKSVGNVIIPQDVIKKYGADIIRLWAASSDYKADIRLSDKILKQLSDAYRKIRNTMRYILSNTNDFDYEKDAVSYDEMLELDKWALMHLQLLKKEVTAAYEAYDFHVLYHAIHNFCSVEMSSFYMDILKDRLYAYKADSKERRSAQTAMYEILCDLVVMLTPVLSFTMEEVWQFMKKPANAPISCQMLPWTAVKEEYLDEALEAKFENFMAVRSEVNKVLEVARRDKVIGNSLDASVELYATGEALEILQSVGEDLKTFLIVSQAKLVEGTSEEATATAREDLKVAVKAAAGQKCERCWIFSEEVGKDAEHPTLCPRCAAALK